MSLPNVYCSQQCLLLHEHSFVFLCRFAQIFEYTTCHFLLLLLPPMCSVSVSFSQLSFLITCTQNFTCLFLILINTFLYFWFSFKLPYLSYTLFMVFSTFFGQWISWSLFFSFLLMPHYFLSFDTLNNVCTFTILPYPCLSTHLLKTFK